MTRTDYRNARRMLRDNGAHAFRWMPNDVREHMRALWNAKHDALQWRVWILETFGAAGIAAEIRANANR